MASLLSQRKQAIFLFFITFILAGLAGCGWLTGCGQEECIDNSRQLCLCTNGIRGTQTCILRVWSECRCIPDTPDASSEREPSSFEEATLPEITEDPTPTDPPPLEEKSIETPLEKDAIPEQTQEPTEEKASEEKHKEAATEPTTESIPEENIPEPLCLVLSRPCYTGPPGTENKGSCRAGKQTCQNGQWSACVGEVVPQSDVCNGKDDDCDGLIDEDPLDPGKKLSRRCYNGPPGTAGIGVCQEGVQYCNTGTWDRQCYGEIIPITEQCDGKDNDCDGLVDNQPQSLLPLQKPCYTGLTGTQGVGACQEGYQLCKQGVWETTCIGEITPTSEVCDGKDNNCNGQIDEDITVLNQPLRRSCYSGPPATAGVASCKTGTQFCIVGAWEKSCRGETTPATETCDGKDNNCDGLVDNIPDLGQDCQIQTHKGVCRQGKWNCVGLQKVCQQQLFPSSESCDLQDNDCDGLLDNVASGFCASREIRIAAGSFVMGSPGTEPGRLLREDPPHQVTLTRDFALFQYEVTQGLFSSLMGYNPSYFNKCGASCPVETINKHEAMAFCNTLSQNTGMPLCYSCTPPPVYGQVYNGQCELDPTYYGDGGKNYYTCKGYRLPTEAEWEYAARATTQTAFYNGNITQLLSCMILDANLDKIGWYCGNSNRTTHPVGQKLPNKWGLFDMLGNVTEWVYDHLASYPSSAQTDPIASFYFYRHLTRGGAWGAVAEICRAASRDEQSSNDRYPGIGFRPARTL